METVAHSHTFKVLGLCCLVLLSCVRCSQSHDLFDTASSTYTPDITLRQFLDGSATPGLSTSLPYPAAERAWTSTPGWLTPPTLPLPPSSTFTATMIFDTPQPGQEQGIRGTLYVCCGLPMEDGSLLPPWTESGVNIFVLDSASKKVIAQTQSGSHGRYELKLMPGRYDLCASHGDSYCEYPDLIVKAGRFIDVDLTIPTQ